MRNSTETEIARIESKAKLAQTSARVPILKLQPPTSGPHYDLRPRELPTETQVPSKHGGMQCDG